MQKYDPKKIEKKWQAYWAKNKTFEVKEDKKKEKFYSLIEFPYPSGEGLHVGHPRPFTAMDVISRKKRMEGKNVLFPIGFDAFGLPTENFAIKTGKPPAEVTKKNIANFTRQLKMLGFSFDWSRQVDTTDPNYYKWTQKLFLQFFKHGLAYKKNQPINWCPKDKIGLANEEVVNGNCERCGTAVEKRNKEQWMLAITKYADKLLDGLKNVDYIERAKAQQENWIGKSEGAEVDFPLRMVPGQTDDKHFVKVFTTRPDTIFGATFLAVSAELAKSWVDVGWQAGEEVRNYIDEVLKNKANITSREEQEKTGVNAGIVAVNPVSKKEIPVWITNYVMGEVGTGAIMGVPAHDQRDFDFAKKFGLPIKKVVSGGADKPKYLIFDFDGVIGDTYEASMQTRIKMGDVKDRAEAEESCRKYFNQKPDHTKNHSLTEEQMKEKHAWTQRYGEIKSKIPFPLFENFVNEIKKLNNTKIAIISAGSGLYMREPSLKSGLNPTHVLSFEDHHSKEEKIEMVCKDWGISIQDVYYFTDSKADVYELEDCMDRKKIIGCAWGYCGYDALRELLPENQTLKNPEDVHSLFGETLYENDGVAIESDFLNGLKTPEAKEKMIEFLEENKIGKKQINYKLRDWVFSRQRYWGEPIPLVYCEHCKNKKQKALLIHGFEADANSNWLPWMKTELEKQGFEVMVPDLPDSKHPNLEKWLEVLRPHFDKLGENDVLVGHSLGSKAALHLLEKSKKKIGHVYLVASAIGEIAERDWSLFRKHHDNVQVDALQKFWATKFDWKKVDAHAENKTIVISSDDLSVPKGVRGEVPSSWTFKKWNGFKHFTASAVPELLEEFLHAKNTGWIPLPESELPLKLPKVEKYQPTDTGESPLAAITSWLKTKCPNCGGAARRETDTMPNWAGSSWYFLAYALGGEKRLKEKGDKFWNVELLKHWQPVDWYNGGMEHTVLHLLYSRFWNQFLYDVGMVPTPEPYTKRTSHGMILAKGGEKMSKSRGNVVNPDEMVDQFGADALRTYIMFMGPFDQAVEWDTNGLVGVKRFLDKVFHYYIIYLEPTWKHVPESAKGENSKNSSLNVALNKTIKKVSEDIEGMRFNTAISALMELRNLFTEVFARVSSTTSNMVAQKTEEQILTRMQFENFIKLLSPFAPHLCEELWQLLGNKKSLAHESWPQYDPKLIQEQEITLAVQVNGKLRETLNVAADISEEDAKQKALASANVQKWLEGKEPKKVIYVKGKLVSIVV